MIIVQLFGGLGNQMFQYAFGKQLSILYKVPFKIDKGVYKDVAANSRLDVRVYGLKHFNISAQETTREDITKFNKYIRPDIIGKFNRFISRQGLYYKKEYIIEPAEFWFKFDNRLFTELDTKQDLYMRGYWQSYKYFENIRELLLREFSVKTSPSPKNLELIERISKTNSVSLHIRRGNNLDPKNSFGTLPFSYYQKSIGGVVKKVSEPHFFVFSDDPKWVKENIRIDYPVIFADNDENSDFEDMRLMSACKHHITANSTFSWWGAWLSSYQNKIVYVPPRLHLNADIPMYDFYPPTWNIVD